MLTVNVHSSMDLSKNEYSLFIILTSAFPVFLCLSNWFNNLLQFRFPFVSCEIFTCEIDVILKTLVEEEEV